jgi:UDP-N-acetylmuramoyl-L-alanyl-D-glutamate--2,6-diaminopimelate ligase
MPLRTLDSVDAALGWLAQRGAHGLTTDSRRVRPGDAFVAWPGYAVDARRFVRPALDAGARACLVEADGATAFGGALDDAAVGAMADLKAWTGPLASRFYGSPSERLHVIAITGTNGKTSTAWWVAQAMGALGRRCALVGTLGLGEPASAQRAAVIVHTGMTTPDPVTLQIGLKRFADDGVQACAIEATSIGLAEHRLSGTRMDTAVFTNFTQDHLDYHGSMTQYWQAKAALFEWQGLRAAAINVDDPQGSALAASLRASVLDVWTCSALGDARLAARAIRQDDAGLGFDVVEGAQQIAVRTQLVGAYNVSNLLGVFGALRAAGFGLADIAAVCPTLTPVPGRLQTLPSTATQPRVVVDYAHTPDALEKALQALQPLAQRRGGQLWCVFGCGGNRDAAKRPLMGGVAQRLAHRVVLTSDNPRFEAPDAILRQIAAGLSAGRDDVETIEDRRAAITHAVQAAHRADVVLIAGKGHEQTQEIAGVALPFSDALVAAQALDARSVVQP